MSITNRVETIYIRTDAALSQLCHIAKNLFNEANYIIRQSFIGERVWVRYYDLWKQLKDSDNYKLLPGHTAQQILRSIDKSWKAFFNAIKIWKKEPGKFKKKPGLPRYKDKNGEFALLFTNQQVSIRNHIFKLPKKIGLEVKTRLNDNTKLKGARIIPMGIGYNLEIIYEIEVPDKKEPGKRVLGIDLGVNNLVTAVNNIGEQPIIIKGGIVKSWNQYFNKKKAGLQSVYDRQGIKVGHKSKKLGLKRKRKIKDYFHRTSKQLIAWCVEHEIDTIVIGHNADWKQGVNIGKRNNQNFVSIPFYVLTQQITYKAEEHGINVVLQEESYTSKCSFFDGEDIGKHDEYVGNRVHRGLFKTAGGMKVNADVNGAYNILKKAFPGAYAKGIEGLGVAPRRLII